MKLILTYPIWFILICILTGVIFASVLYFKDKKLRELSKFWKRLLFLLRFFSVSLITFLLLEPLFENNKNTTEKPIIVIAEDNSESILFNKDSSYITSAYTTNKRELITNLSSKYEVKTYSFGNDLSINTKLNYSEKETNISKAISEINEKYYNRNLGAIVIATDGIYNKGNNPLVSSKKLKNIPVYTIAMGDTALVKDVLIEKVINNKLAYKGNDFPVEIVVKSFGVNRKKSNLKILKNNKVIRQTEVFFDKKEFLNVFSFSIEASGNGLQKYTVIIDSVEGEFTVENNIQNFYIDVLESKQKILLLADAPHPDINQLKRTIETNKNYEVTTSVINDFNNKIEEYGLIILHNLPSANYPSKALLSKIDNLKIPVFIVLGNSTNYNVFNNLKLGLTVNKVGSFSDAQGYINKSFTLFKISDKLKQNIVKFPPLQVPFSQQFKLSNSCNVLAFQKIGITKTDYPLLVFNNKEGSKKGFLIGEGIWRWKIYDFLEHQNNVIFNELITQSVQYLAAKEDKSFFKVFSDNDFLENEAVFIQAEVYNKSYELDNKSDVSIVIKNEGGNEFPYTFTKEGNRYELKAGILPPGNYTYLAKTIIDAKEYKEIGEFFISEIKVEQMNTVADHQLLFNIADITGGKLFYPNQLTALEKELSNREDITPVVYTKTAVDDLINIKYIFFLILLLLSLEWFFRKRNGGY